MSQLTRMEVLEKLRQRYRNGRASRRAVGSRCASCLPSHSNPIFILVGDQPIRASLKSAEWCLQGVESAGRRSSVSSRPTNGQTPKWPTTTPEQTYRRLVAECQASVPTAAEAKPGQ